MEAVDFFFEVVALEEPELGCTHHVTMIEWLLAPANDQWPVETLVPGNVIESFTTDGPYEAVEAAREAQAYSLEDRLDMEYEREMRGLI